ncbi:MAG: hypothetical protein AABZ53_12125 [Planctomycetota bacterium]
MKLSHISLLCAAAACSPAFAQQVWLNYNPSDNRLPDTQCWTLERSGGPLPSVSDNVLTLGPSSSSAYLYYEREAAISFSRGAVIEAEVFIVDSAYSSNPCGSGQRAGFFLTMFDNTGKLMYLGIGNSTIFTTSDAGRFPGPSAPTAAVAAQGVWRTYRVEVDAATISVYVDGTLTLTAPSNGPSYGTSRQASFGDQSVCSPGHSKVRRVSVLVVEDCPVDFNRDGAVDFFDYDDYVNCFEGGPCPCDQTADFDRDGSSDFFDYDAFVVAFTAGC